MEIESRLFGNELRYTTARKAIVTALITSGGPLSAAELHAELGGSVPLSSIYRSLAILEHVGILTPHLGTKGLTRYELAEWLRGHHHHLVCIDCGAVEDVAVDDSHENSVDAVVKEVTSRVAFTPINHALEIEGRCAKCA